MSQSEQKGADQLTQLCNMYLSGNLGKCLIFRLPSRAVDIIILPRFGSFRLKPIFTGHNRLQTDQGCDIGSSCRHTFACPLGGMGIITTFFVHVCSRVRGGEDVLECLDKYTLILISQYYKNIPLAKWGCERVLPQYLSNHRYIGHREIKAKTGLWPRSLGDLHVCCYTCWHWLY